MRYPVYIHLKPPRWKGSAQYTTAVIGSPGDLPVRQEIDWLDRALHAEDNGHIYWCTEAFPVASGRVRRWA